MLENRYSSSLRGSVLTHRVEDLLHDLNPRGDIKECNNKVLVTYQHVAKGGIVVLVQNDNSS